MSYNNLKKTYYKKIPKYQCTVPDKKLINFLGPLQKKLVPKWRFFLIPSTNLYSDFTLFIKHLMGLKVQSQCRGTTIARSSKF
jgi:hypothetical protein